jgi:L,D-peptidoglycan transpeptidase YkuD (ErfK/YbiS/YcfS/YnhG family)
MQWIEVVSKESNSIEAELSCYEDQKLIFGKICAEIGKNGVTSNKVEGDMKSPVGTFKLGPVFGDKDHQVYAKNMPYLLITDDLECVDDPNSIYYNQFVYKNQIKDCDWKSSEKMKEMGDLYSLGIVIQYNQNPVIPNKGSAIFIHKLNKRKKGTHGCVALDENYLKKIVSWIDSSKDPFIKIN